MSEDSPQNVQPTPPRQCPACRAVLRDDAPDCWLCHRPRDGSEPIYNPQTETPRASLSTEPASALPPTLPSEPPAHFTFSLSTLMLAMTLAAVLSGLCAIAPGIGIPLAILAVPAWIRAARVMRFRPHSDANPSLGKKVEAFFSSLGLAMIICIPAGAAGFAACTGVVLFGFGRGNPGLDIAFPIGMLIGGVLAMYIFVKLMIPFGPRRKK